MTNKASSPCKLSVSNDAETDKFICLKASEKYPTLAMDECRIYIRVIGKLIPKKELEIYFGGDISSMEQINEEEYIITFEDQQVAKNVTIRAHTINEAQIEVSCHPFIGENTDTPANESSVVIIRGLSEDTTEDALGNYLENTRRSDGGPVEEVRITGNSARVKFESSEVANRVVQHDKHTLNGATLDVSIEMHANCNEGGKTIMVTGLATKTTEDSILNYFEIKRRSGGGAVENVDFRHDTGVAFVTFEDADDVTTVLQIDQHSIDGAALTITLSDVAVGLTEKEEIQESRTIEVTGLASTATKDSIINYFENTRRSGGGETENVEFTPDKGYAVVTFLSAESAQGVMNKGNLTLDNAELKVTLRKPTKKLPIDSVRLLVKGLSEKSTPDSLQSYMEVVSGLEVLDIEFGEQGCALVLFSEAYDYDTIAQKAVKRKLDGKMLSIEKVPVCNCVKVTGLNRENTTNDAVFYYFENSKNGGGDVNNVELHIEEGWALVHFEDPQVVTKVMAKSHILNDAQLQVKLHNPIFAKPVSLPDEHEVALVKQIPVEAQEMLFIRERHQGDMRHLQEKHGVKINWEEGSSRITVAPVDKRSMDKDRFQDASAAIASFVGAFQTKTVNVTSDAWNAVEEKFKENGSSVKDKLKIQYMNQQHKIAITGMKQEVEGIAGELKELKTEIERQLALEASKITNTVKNIPPIRLKFLSDLDFDKELQIQYENTQVDFIPDKGQVHIRGPPEIIHKTTGHIWQAVATMKELSLEMSQNAVEVLRSRAGQSFMKDQFTANNLQARLIFDSGKRDEFSGTVGVIGMNSDFAHKASHLVKTIIVEESLRLEEGQVQLEKSEKWRLLSDELTASSILIIKFDRNSKTLWLAGRKEDVSSALRSVKRFLKENTIVSKVVELPRGCRRFLTKFREQDLRQIQEELNKHSTLINGIAGDDDEDVIVTGTTDGVDKGMSMIHDLASTIKSQKVPINKPGMRKSLKRSKGKKMLALLENEHKCVIEHLNAEKDASSRNETDEEKEDAKTLKKECECSFLTPEGKTIKVFKDNICDRNVDVIVNAASPKLQHSSGISKAIVDAGGEVIHDECDKFIIEHGSILEGQVVVTSAGKMPFKKVVHAVAPLWTNEATREKSMGKTPREEKLLRYAVSNALDAAKHFTSIALPAISRIALEFPRDLCANIMFDATVAFCEENPGCRLSEIQFTSTDDAVVKAFVTEMTTRFGQDLNFQDSPKVASGATGKGKGKGRKKTDPTPPPVWSNPNGPNDITTPEGLNVVLVAGDMTREQVDAIVNSTSSDLDLSRNASAKALSAAAGPKLQQECKAIGQVQTGDIVVTSGGDLKCKHVFHTSCADWESGKGEQVLRDIITKSLNEAKKRGLSSIAIPAIGTGNLQFPHNRVAAASFDEVLTFSKNNPSGTVKEVHLVVYDKDLLSVQAFRSELQNRKRNPPPSPSPSQSGNKRRRRSRGAAAKMSDLDDTPDDFDASDDEDDDALDMVPEELDPLKPQINIGSVTVQAETGDITKEVTDAIVALSNTELNVAFGGGVGKAILAEGGPSIQAECSSLGIQAPGAVVVTGAGRLQATKIYHMVPDKFNMASIKDCIVKCLKAADSHGLTSISFPALGTGNVKVGVKESAHEMLAAIAKFAEEQPTSLHFIRIVIYQSHMFQVFHNEMEACVSSMRGGPGFLWKLAGFFGFGKSSSSSSYPTTSKKSRNKKEKTGSYLEIFAGTKQDVKKAVEELHNDLADQCITKVIEKDAISKLSKEQKRKLMNLEEKHDATIRLEEPIGRISIRGYPEDVFDVATTIHEILDEQKEEEHSRDVEELVCKTVQWYYSDDDDEGLQSYDPRINFQIENAFDSGQGSVFVLIDEARCEIVFKDMKETCLADREERNVIRKEIGKGVPLPHDWCAQPKLSSGKEKEVHLAQLDPFINSTEYNKVADEIRKTASINITKIERVQNPGLYRQYMVRKDQMEQKNGANEKFLFHGTAEGSCSSISKFGFNRSYCGKHATMYGNGVYFARDALYSTQSRYSPPDATGNRYLYLAHVLVGEHAMGRNGMLTPPAKGSDATDAYDSVVDNVSNPSIFVVFYDNQCYPDYLITFK